MSNYFIKDDKKTKDDKSEESSGYKILADNTDDKKKVTVDELETKYITHILIAKELLFHNYQFISKT